MKRFVLAITAIFLIFSLVACSTDSNRPDTEDVSLTENSLQDSGHSEVGKNLPAEGNTQDTKHTESGNGGGTAIILNMNDTDIHARRLSMLVVTQNRTPAYLYGTALKISALLW